MDAIRHGTYCYAAYGRSAKPGPADLELMGPAMNVERAAARSVTPTVGRPAPATGRPAGFAS